MATEISIQRFRKWYARLLRLYPNSFYERFGESMEQTFSDLLCECKAAQGRMFTFAFRLFVETATGIVRENTRSIAMQHKNIIRIALVTACILLVPLVAMQFTDEVVWNAFDFVVAGALLFGTGLTYELVTRRSRKIAYRGALAVALASALFLTWANLAVGIIGSENEPANLMYFGVLAVGIIGAVAARFRPLGMARALLAMAGAQALIAAIALLAGMDEYPGSSVAEILLVNGLFAGMFIVSALLFQRVSLTNASGPRSELGTVDIPDLPDREHNDVWRALHRQSRRAERSLAHRGRHAAHVSPDWRLAGGTGCAERDAPQITQTGIPGDFFG